jgi:hypothetical protein
MKLNELLSEFQVQTSNEEDRVLEKCSSLRPIHMFSERDRFVIEGLIRKSLVSKVVQNGSVLIVKNDLQ